MLPSRVEYARVVVAATALVACGDVTFVNAPKDGAVPFAGSLFVDAGDARATSRPPPSDAASAACAPNPAPNFSPLWRPPAIAPACGPSDAAAVIDCLINAAALPSAGDMRCLDKAESDCFACLVTPEASPALGPIIARTDGTYVLNFAGCVALVTQDTSASSCGARRQATEECVGAACTNCKSLVDSRECSENAEPTVCVAYHDACLTDPLFASAIVTTCGPERQDLAAFATKAYQYADLFCGMH
jgi:hypothetical protein